MNTMTNNIISKSGKLKFTISEIISSNLDQIIVQTTDDNKIIFNELNSKTLPAPVGGSILPLGPV